MKVYKSNLFISFLSTVLILVLIELFFSLKNHSNKKQIQNFDQNNRYMLFEEGGVFQNVDNFFKYLPNKKILSKTFYKVDNNWIEEYSYTFETNNYGLVQKNDILKNKKSILFLGDSFVEGQGAKPWIERFKGKYKDYQIINGGILGTGPQQFELIDQHIDKEYSIDKVLLFYIGDDIRRNPFNISKSSLDCLKNHKHCSGNENFYGFPFYKKDHLNFLNSISEKREKKLSEISFSKKVKKRIKKFFLNLYIVKIPNNLIKQKLYSSKNIYIQRNFESINRLNNKYESNIIYIQMKNKNEIVFGKEYETFFTENYIKKISKNHFICDFNNDISFFHKIDMHPNKKGYSNLFKCVKNILDKNIN